MVLNSFKHNDWVVYFSGGKWLPLGFSHWISLYTQRPFTKKIDYFVKQTIMVCDGETTTCYVRESERETFGKKIVAIVKKDPKYINKICQGFSQGADHILSIYKKNITLTNYQAYLDYFNNYYYIYHLQVKNVIDFLPKSLLNTYLPKLEAARIHAEPVFSQEVHYIQKLAQYISKKTKYNKKYISYSYYNELIEYWKNGKKFVEKKELQERQRGCIILFKNGAIQKTLTGAEIQKFSSFFISKSITNQLTGNTAFPGKIKGIARVIFNPKNVPIFNQGDILIAPWTRPEYLPIMRKASAFITDGGGMLSHAAIVARELKKPCIIATKNATQLIKNGDKIEIDANKGTIRIIK